MTLVYETEGRGGGEERLTRCWIRTAVAAEPMNRGHRTSRGQLGAPAGAAVVVSVLGAELGARVGEAAHPAGRAAEVIGVNTVIYKTTKEKVNFCHREMCRTCTGKKCFHR